MMTAASPVAERLAARGFRPGLPVGLPLAVLALDADSAAESECPECERTGLAVQAWCCGQRYALLGMCPRCGVETEL